MPTIHRELGFRFFFYSNEGKEPAHIHILGKSGEMKIWLDPVHIANTYNMLPKDQKTVLRIINENLAKFKLDWSKWHDSNG